MKRFKCTILSLLISTNIIEAIIGLILAVVLGAIARFGREITRKPARLRNHMLVCLGSCLFTTLSLNYPPKFSFRLSFALFNTHYFNQQDGRLLPQIPRAVSYNNFQRFFILETWTHCITQWLFSKGYCTLNINI